MTTTDTLTVSKTADLKGLVAKASKPMDVVKDLDIPVEQVTVTEAALPAIVKITEETRNALDVLPAVFGGVQVTESRTLAPEEIAKIYKEQESIREVSKVLTARDEAIKETIRHHIDREAEAQKKAFPNRVVVDGQVAQEATQKDASGHYILSAPQEPYRVNIPGTNQAYSQEFRAGASTFSSPEADLLDLLESGQITREQYLSVTREVRAFDEKKAMEAMSKDPEAYVPIIRALARRKADGTSLFTRKAK